MVDYPTEVQTFKVVGRLGRGDYPATAGSIGPRRFSMGVAGWNGTPPVLASFIARAAWGPLGFDSGANDQSTTISNEIFPSWILYWLYIEDLTVSGRAWAQVEALDKAKYDREVVASTGRYYGDTFTAPSTLP